MASVHASEVASGVLGDMRVTVGGVSVEQLGGPQSRVVLAGCLGWQPARRRRCSGGAAQATDW